MHRSFTIKVFLLFILIQTTVCQIPQTLSYQGVLTDASGQIVPDNNYTLTFSLYDTETGGTGLWQEQHTTNIQKGMLNIVLGSITPITLPFEKQYWLGIKIGEGNELTPRVQLTSNAYSLNSKSVIDNSITASKIVDGAVTQSKLSGDITLPPGGTASGDLSGSYPNPTVARLQGRDISSTSPTTNQVLKYNGTNWAPGTDNSGGEPSGTASGDLSGSYPNPTVSRLQGRDVSSTSPTTNQILKYNGTSWAPGTDNSGGEPSGTASGDLSGSYPNPTVSRIQGRDISSTSPTTNQVLKYNGTSWAPGTDNSGGVPSGTASGDLTGTYPNPTVAKIQGKDVSSTAPTNNQVLKYNGTSWAPGTDNSGGAPSGSAGGDLSGTYPNPTVSKIQGKDISSTLPSTNQILKYNGTAWAPGTDNSGGAPSGSAGGDLSGSYPNPTVAQIQGRDVSKTAPTTNQVLKYNGTSWAPAADATGIGGSGTSNYIPVFNSSNNLTSSSISQSVGGDVSVGGKLAVSTEDQWAGYFTNNSLNRTTIYANNSYASNSMAIAIMGVSNPSPGYGIAGNFVGGYVGLCAAAYGESSNSVVTGVKANSYGNTGFGARYGVEGTANGGIVCAGVQGSATDGTTSYGVLGHASGGSDNFGIFGSANGVTHNYGLYGVSSGGTQNYAVYASGDLLYTGNLIHVSDAKLKEGIRPLSNTLSKVLQLNVSTYSFSQDLQYASMNLSKGNHYGITAQDIEKVFPELVVDAVHPGKENEKGEPESSINYKGVKSMELIPILIQAVKEQQTMISEQGTVISELKNEVSELKRKFEQLINK